MNLFHEFEEKPLDKPYVIGSKTITTTMRCKHCDTMQVRGTVFDSAFGDRRNLEELCPVFTSVSFAQLKSEFEALEEKVSNLLLKKESTDDNTVA